MTELNIEVSHFEVDVSVIVANYNGERFIADALRSAGNQSLRNIEIILSDDASTDSSVEIVRSLIREDSRIRLLESNVNSGAAAARNRALDVARGRWLCVMDSDDLMHPDRLQSLIEACEVSGADMIADDVMLFDTYFIRPPYTLLGGRGKFPRWVSAKEYLATGNLYGSDPALGYLKPIIRASFVRKHSIRYDERLIIAEDYNFVFQLLMAGAKFWIVPNAGYFYRRHGQSLSHRLSLSALNAMEGAERDWDVRWPSVKLQGLFRSRSKSVQRAIVFEKLVLAIKQREFGKAVMIAVTNPRVASLLRLPLQELIVSRFHRRKTPRRGPVQICVLSRQRITGRINGSSRYLLDIAGFLNSRGFDIHLLVPSPVTMGRWPFLRLSNDMSIFKTIKIRGTFRLGRYIIVRDIRIVMRGILALVDRLLYRSGLLSRPLFRAAPYAIAQPLSQADQLFVAREAPLISDVLIADYCFMTPAYPFALRPDARRIVIMHDLFSSRPSQFAKLTTSDSVVALSFDEEVRLLAAAQTVVAIQWDEAARLQPELPHQNVVVAPIAALPVDQPQAGLAEIVMFVGSSTAPNIDGIRWFMEMCWPIVLERRPNAVLNIVGSVCNSVAKTGASVRLLDVVENLDELYTEASVVISPLRVGSGLKIKLIEGLSKGKAMVATTATMQGVADLLGDCALIEDSAAGFAGMVADLLGDRRKRDELGTKGIIAILRYFSPDHAYGAIAAAAELTRMPETMNSRGSI